MNNDDLWKLDGEAGPALPLSDDAVHRLVSGAVGRAYGTAREEPAPAAARSGFGAAKQLMAGVGIVACVVGGWTASRPDRRAHSAHESVPTASPVTTATIATASTAHEHVPTMDVQSLPSAPVASSVKAPRSLAGATETSRDLLREANRLRAERRWDDAATLYRRVADAKSEETPAAMLALASLRLEHQNDAREAQRLYRAVVAGAPDGPLAEEARWGTVMAARALGDAHEEHSALQSFLTHHPSSLSATKARQRLAELDAGANKVTP